MFSFSSLRDGHDGHDRGAEDGRGLELHLLDHGAVSEIVLDDLADRGCRQGVDHDDPLRLCRRLGDVVLHIALQEAGIERGARRRNGIEDRHLAGIGVGHADRGADLHARKAVGHVLDVGRVDVVAAAHDQILGAAGQHQPLIVGQITDVAGIEPTVRAQDVLIVLGVDIAREHLRPFDQHQAARPGRTVRVAAGGIEADDPGLGKRRPEADAALQRRAAAGIEGNGGRRLGHAVGLIERDPGSLGEALAHGFGTDRPAGQPHPNRRDVGVSDRYFGQRRDRRGNPAHDRDTEGFDHVPIGSDRLAVAQAVGRGNDHVAAGRQHRETGRHGPAHVKERETVDHDVVSRSGRAPARSPRRREFDCRASGGRAWAARSCRRYGRARRPCPGTRAARTPVRRRCARSAAAANSIIDPRRRPASPAPRSSSTRPPVR